MMTKQDFIGLADALRPVLNVEHVDAEGNKTMGPAPVVDALCAFMRSSNPRFKDRLWREYLAGNCGPNGGKIAAPSQRAAKVDETMERIAEEDTAARDSAQRAPKTGASCPHRSPIERDNCPSCEGTGMRIDFAAIHRARLAHTRKTKQEGGR